MVNKSSTFFFCLDLKSETVYNHLKFNEYKHKYKII